MGNLNDDDNFAEWNIFLKWFKNSKMKCGPWLFGNDSFDNTVGSPSLIPEVILRVLLPDVLFMTVLYVKLPFFKKTF